MCEGAIFPAAWGVPNPWGGTNIPREFGMGVPNSRGCQIPYWHQVCSAGPDFLHSKSEISAAFQALEREISDPRATCQALELLCI